MSSSHAQPDSMHISEADLVSTDALPVSSRIPRLSSQLNAKKIIRTAGMALLGIVFVGALAVIAVMATQLSDLTIRVNSLDAAFRSGQIGQLAASVSAQERRIKELEEEAKTVATAKSNEINRLSGENQEIKTQFIGLMSHVETLQSSLSSTESRISKLESELSKSKTVMDELSLKSLQKASAPLKEERVAPSRSATTKSLGVSAKKTNRSAGRIAAPVAPFSLTGIERRGGHIFAVIIPSGVTAVSQMKLLSPGDSTQGWVLRAINGNEAVFTFNGAERRLSVQ